LTIVRSVESPHYHLWTDALHARELARRSKNDWDRGTYVRWTIQSSWTAFEMACEDALERTRLGTRMKDNLDQALHHRQLSAIDWGQGLWQRVVRVQSLRHDYTHPGLEQHRLFAPTGECEFAIDVLRAAIKDIYARVGKQRPLWVEDDRNPEEPGSMAFAKVTRAGAKEGDPDVIAVSYTYRGEEHTSEVLPAGSDPEPVMQQLLESIIVPISAVRAYRGKELILEWNVRMRGS